jgi:hypothetical protein
MAGVSVVHATPVCHSALETTPAGSFAGEVCVDLAAGTISVTGTAVLDGGGQVNISSEGTISIQRTQGKPTITITGSLLITDASTGNIILRRDLTATGGSLSLAVHTFAGQVVDLTI